jgi:hypothetical protein
MVAGEPASGTPIVPTDPVDFPDTIPLRMRFQYEDEQHENIFSLGVEQVRTMKEYTLIGPDGTTERITSAEGSLFLLAYIEVYHLGHKSYTYQYQEYSPERTAFRIFYNGFNYTPSTNAGMVQSGTDVWHPYNSQLMDRYEHHGGILLFELPDSVTLSRTYLGIDLGEGRKPVWRLG